MHIEVDSHQLTIQCLAVILRELCNQLIAAHKGKPPVPMMAFVCTLCETKPHDVVSSGICRDKLDNMHSCVGQDMIGEPYRRLLKGIW